MSEQTNDNNIVDSLAALNALLDSDEENTNEASGSGSGIDNEFDEIVRTYQPKQETPGWFIQPSQCPFEVQETEFELHKMRGAYYYRKGQYATAKTHFSHALSHVRNKISFELELLDSIVRCALRDQGAGLRQEVRDQFETMTGKVQNSDQQQNLWLLALDIARKYGTPTDRLTFACLLTKLDESNADFWLELADSVVDYTDGVCCKRCCVFLEAIGLIQAQYLQRVTLQTALDGFEKTRLETSQQRIEQRLTALCDLHLDVKTIRSNLTQHGAALYTGRETSAGRTEFTYRSSDWSVQTDNSKADWRVSKEHWVTVAVGWLQHTLRRALGNDIDNVQLLCCFSVDKLKRANSFLLCCE